jgi:hypothetical protein
MKKKEYIQYLNTEHWINLRNKKVKDCYRCFMCHSQERLSLHHLNYTHLGNEVDNDTVVLCSRCHYRAHFCGKNNKKKLDKKYKRMLYFRRNGIQRTIHYYLTQNERREYETMLDLSYT